MQFLPTNFDGTWKVNTKSHVLIGREKEASIGQLHPFGHCTETEREKMIQIQRNLCNSSGAAIKIRAENCNNTDTKWLQIEYIYNLETFKPFIDEATSASTSQCKKSFQKYVINLFNHVHVLLWSIVKTFHLLRWAKRRRMRCACACEWCLLASFYGLVRYHLWARICFMADDDENYMRFFNTRANALFFRLGIDFFSGKCETAKIIPLIILGFDSKFRVF